MFVSSGYLMWVLIPTFVISAFAQWRVKSAFRKWVKVRNEKGLTGVETAQIIMRDRGLDAIAVEGVQGELTDHYDPRSKTIRLSETSKGSSVAAMAIVAHELGHAEQDLTGNAMLRLRTAIVPVANIGSRLSWILIIAGLLLNILQLAWLGVFLFGAAVLFTLVTLPVEFDASRRAKANLSNLHLVSATESKGVDAVLNAAALTYVAAAAGAILQLVYWISVVGGGRRS
jgi:Zn-dependent membrane protease YugP